MAEANHGWNLFKEFFEEPLKGMVFQVKSNKERSSVPDQKVSEIRYHDLFCSSTDYSEATDHFD